MQAVVLSSVKSHSKIAKQSVEKYENTQRKYIVSQSSQSHDYREVDTEVLTSLARSHASESQLTDTLH